MKFCNLIQRILNMRKTKIWNKEKKKSRKMKNKRQVLNEMTIRLTPILKSSKPLQHGTI
jgi:hypothetical protein